MTWVIVTLAVVAAAGLGWALFEAQWVELLERDAPVRGLPAELDGLRVLHVSDFHLGTLSLNGRALQGGRLGEPARSRSRRRDGGSRQPTSGSAHLDRGARSAAATTRHVRGAGKPRCRLHARPLSVVGRPERRRDGDLLDHESVILDIRGRAVQVAGGDPRRHPEPHGPLARPETDLRVLLVHFPDPVNLLAPGGFTSSSQDTCTAGRSASLRRAARFEPEHLRAHYWEGLFELPQRRFTSPGPGHELRPLPLPRAPGGDVLRLRRAE